MKDIKVELRTFPDFDPVTMIGGLARLTQVKKEFAEIEREKGLRILKALFTMGHTSLLECADFGFIVEGASRVFLAQITRHRQASYTSGSQQYQLHNDFPYTTPDSIKRDGAALIAYEDLMEHAARTYDFLEKLVGRDDARYVIPGAARNNLYIKWNLREILCVAVPQRICRRNTPESQLVIALMLRAMVEKGFEDVVRYAGPACVTEGKCNQGTMCCGRPFGSWDELLRIPDELCS